MRIGIVGAGRIGGNCAVQFAKGGHEVKLSSRDPSKLEPLAQEIGEPPASARRPRRPSSARSSSSRFPGTASTTPSRRAGSLDGKIVIDTTNQYGSVRDARGRPRRGASFHAARMRRRPLHEELQHPHLGLPGRGGLPAGAERVVQWVCGDDDDAKQVVMGLIADAGYVPIDLGGTS